MTFPYATAVRFVCSLGLLLPLWAATAQAQQGADEPRNIVFIFTDDHRYDSMGFMEGAPDWLETPQLDELAAEGVHFRNAFVTTSLCSPSRASVLTGQYMHNHGVVDNGPPIREMPRFFSQYLQEAGYETAFIGKWHMGGNTDERRPGFDHWISFRGQGRYYPPEDGDWTLNVNGRRVPQQGYITDELTDYALDWLDDRDADSPFFLYLSHKGIHDPFTPARRHQGRYENEPFPAPATMADTPENYEGKPIWVKDQRNSWHGVDFPYQGLREAEVPELYRRYHEALLSVDESVGRVMDWLEDNDLAESTLVIYMGDNGFQWGEHGLIDKRTAYEASMRVPLIARCPDLFEAGSAVNGMVANIDIAPTFLDAAGVEQPAHMDGRSFLGLATGTVAPDEWRDYLLYEYYWENAFPHTPTTYAIRGDRYKFIQYYGIWDTDELYDLQNDPNETENLLLDEEYHDTVGRMREQLHRLMAETGAASIPLRPKGGPGQSLRREGKSEAGKFPDHFYRQEKGRGGSYENVID